MSNSIDNNLKRHLGTLSLIIFGIGDILGAGIYVLVGKVAGLVGTACWISFLVAFVVAALTGLSYSELASRYPRSAGASLYSLNAFRKPAISYVVGFLVLLSGVVSMATISHGFAGYAQKLFPDVPTTAIILGFIVVLTLLNLWGIKQSSITNIICTTVSFAGIVIVILAGLKYFGQVDYMSLTPPEGINPHAALLQGGVLAFYAFIGFEDLANMAEEAKNPQKSIPRAIVVSLLVMVSVYLITTIAAVSAVAISELAASNAPLLLVVEKGFPKVPKGLFTIIAFFAVTNTALINYIMSSRILYGMSREGLVPQVFSQVHTKRKTPDIAIGFVFLIVVILAMTEGLVVLAQSTSLLLLIVFFAMHLSLIIVKTRKGEPDPVFQIPIFIPIIGALSCLGLIFYVKAEVFATVGILIAIGIGLFLLQKIYRRKPASAA